MNITKIRRRVADTYALYAISLKIAYFASFVFLYFAHSVIGITLFVITVALDLFTDFLMYDTVRRSRRHLIGWRMLIFKLREYITPEEFLRSYADELASRGGNLNHWEKRFDLIHNSLARVGVRPKGDGRLVNYLPRS